MHACYNTVSFEKEDVFDMEGEMNQVLEKLLQERQEEIIEGIRECIKIDSVRSEAKENAPYGEGAKRALDYALDLGKQMGFRTKNVGNRAGWVEIGEGEEMVAVLGHLDVVPLGEGWKHPGFGAVLEDGILYGRGVLDDKGPTIGAIYGLKAIADAGIKLDRRIRVIFGTDEECDSSCIKYYIEAGEEIPTMGFTPDGDFPLIFFEKGMSFFTIGKKNPLEGTVKVLKMEGGEASNVVTPKCMMQVNGNLKIKEEPWISVKKEDDTMTVCAEGKSAHGSTPELGINAAIRLLCAVQENSFGGDFQNFKDFLLNEIHEETDGKKLGIYAEDEETGKTTVNVGIIQYNEEEMSVTLDIRYPKNCKAEMVREKVYEAAEKYHLDVLKCREVDMLYVPKESELVKKLMKVYKDATGRDNQPLAIGGGTYAKLFKNMVAFGPAFPENEDKIHQPNECASIEELMFCIKISAEAMVALATK